jgi:LysM repeat protein
MILPTCPRAAALSLIAALSVLSGCTTAKYKKSNVGDDRLATPPHNLSPAEYPFDDDGTYRKDWVANPSKAKRSTPVRNAPVSSTPPNTYSAYTAPAPSPPSPAPVVTPPPAPRPKPAPAPKPAASPKPARYHTVSKGDTLYSISRKYGVTVPKLKSTNGLSGDTIRIGQTLRVP